MQNTDFQQLGRKNSRRLKKSVVHLVGTVQCKCQSSGVIAPKAMHGIAFTEGSKLCQ